MTTRHTALALCLVAIPSALAAEAAATFVARAYCMSGRTADGSRTARGIVAADRRVLPLGTRILLTGAGRYTGEYTVRDTGGAIKGHTLDVYIPTRAEALRFGVRRVLVTVLKPLPEPPALPVVPPIALLSMDVAPRVELSQVFPAP